MKIIWSKTASIRADDISNYIAQDSIKEATKWLKQLFVEVDRLEIFPEFGRLVPNFNDEYLREIIFGNYRIVYELKKNAIEILTIWHSRKPLNKENLKR
jgi:toxin ParE1/3/4